MTTYFAWREQNEFFEKNMHRRCDMEIVKLVIDHQESEVAMATIIVAQKHFPPLPALSSRYVYISYNETLIFSGRLVGLPARINDDLISLEFTSEPMESAENFEKLAIDLKRPPYWDDAFCEPCERQNPAEWLEGHAALYAWDRITGNVCVSDIFQGRHVFDATPVFFADSLKVCLAETPLSKMSVNLTVEWIQAGEGDVGLDFKIAGAFTGHIINTLTPDALKADWPATGDKIGQSGYQVVKSSLKEIIPPSTGVLNIYPHLTPEFMCWEDSGQAVRPQRLKRVWLKSELVLQWSYRQKRREVMHFTLGHLTQFDKTIRPLERTLNIKLQNVNMAPSAGTFFQTAAGRQALEHALLRAKSHLAASARCLEIEVTLSLEPALALSMDHSVCITDPRIPGGKAEGKVIAYRLTQDGIDACGWVRFAVAVGTKMERPKPGESIHYAEPDYGNTAIHRRHRVINELTYDDYSHQFPGAGIVNIQGLSRSDIVRNVFVANEAEQQVQKLQNQQYPLRQNLKAVLQEMPTILSFDLLSLKTHDVLEHHIYLENVTPWTAPQQVSLEQVCPESVI